ncbi:MAG: long-chain fatty acid--CoA ligase [Burkholderiaceae bacterium]|nr:long-chain fatty acid--CoA ligase [Burkholderiaceae bacterium]
MANLTSTPHNNPFDVLQTLAELFDWRVAQSPDAEAYRQFDESSNHWVSYSWQEIAQKIMRYRRALTQSNLPFGARIAILLPNGVDAVSFDQAALALGCVPVPMHALDNPESIAYILNDSDAAVLVAATEQQWQSIVNTGLSLPALQQVLVLQKNTDAASSAHTLALESANNQTFHQVLNQVLNLDEWLSIHPDSALENSEQARQVPGAQDLAALVYTSGTTGKPKGVMLTHENVLSNVKAVVQRMSPVLSDVFLSFLPLSHTFERTAGYYLPIAAGACVVFSRSIKQLPQDLLEVRPTILISVPRIYERVYGAIGSKLASSKFNAWLFAKAVAVGWRRFRRTQHLLSDNLLTALRDELAWLVLQPLVARQLANQFGGRLRVAVSGGAALSNTISECFLGLGIPIVQGYGMTETAPVVAFNAPDDNDPSTVGKPVAKVAVTIGENKELLVKGPNVMRGYWKREEDTAKTFIDGWLRTGDQAEIVAGRIRILGRVKEIIVTSTGEKIAPVDLELAITSDPVFEQAYAFGDNVPFLGCAVVLKQSYWRDLCASLQLDPALAGCLQAPAAVDAVLQRVRALTKNFPFYAQPKAVILSLEAWTIENTLITPTLKLKRQNLAKHFAAEIAAMYAAKHRSN